MEAASVIAWTPLGELLVERKLLTADELDDALAHQARNGELLGAILVQRKVLTGAQLTMILAEQAGVELDIEPGFGSGLFAKLATRSDANGDSSIELAPLSSQDARTAAGSARPVVSPPDDPAFEVSRLRSELELAQARIAELEQKLAARPAGGARKRSAAG